MILVHHLNDSRSQRILWLLEELELTYEVKRYERDPLTMLAPDSLRAVDGVGKAPILQDGPHLIAESGAIVDWLLERYGDGRLSPAPGTDAWIRARTFTHAAEGSLMPLLLLGLVLEQASGRQTPALIRPVARVIARGVRARFLGPRLREQFERVERALQPGPFLAGDTLTAADIMMSFPLQAAAHRGLNPGPRIDAWLGRIHARPAWRRALERGGPFSLGQHPPAG